MVDYKYRFKNARLSVNQKKVFNTICLTPTAHPYSAKFRARYELTASVVRSALKVLQEKKLVIKDQDGLWHLRDPGMQAWWHAVQVEGTFEEIESLRFGDVPQQQNFLKKIAVKFYEQGVYGIGKACELCGVSRAEFLRILLDDGLKSESVEWSYEDFMKECVDSKEES